MFKAPPFPAPALSFTSRRQQRSQVESRQLGPFRRGTELKAAEAAKPVPKRSFQTVQLFRLLDGWAGGPKKLRGHFLA